jgi:MMP 1-O-methyltransferase
MRALDGNGGTVEVNGVKGYLTFQDVVFLFNLASELPLSGTYVEIGSWLGLSTIAFSTGLLANVNVGARVYSVDTWNGSPEHQSLAEIRNQTALETYNRNIQEAGISTYVTAVRGESSNLARSWKHGPIDMLFVDGDHSYDACLGDLECWSPLLAPRGRILGHDAAPGSGVASAVAAFAQNTGQGAYVLPPPDSHFIWQLVSSASAPVPPKWIPL